MPRIQILGGGVLVCVFRGKESAREGTRRKKGGAIFQDSADFFCGDRRSLRGVRLFFCSRGAKIAFSRRDRRRQLAGGDPIDGHVATLVGKGAVRLD